VPSAFLHLDDPVSLGLAPNFVLLPLASEPTAALTDSLKPLSTTEPARNCLVVIGDGPTCALGVGTPFSLSLTNFLPPLGTVPSHKSAQSSLRPTVSRLLASYCKSPKAMVQLTLSKLIQRGLSTIHLWSALLSYICGASRTPEPDPRSCHFLS
jgi:hypothetical protein